MRDICYSGGARGADSIFSKSAYAVGHDVWHQSFIGHQHEANEGLYSILYEPQLQAADPFLKQANKTLDRNFPPRNLYTLNLLRRNYYQIKDVERVYAIAPIDKEGHVMGGTAWAVQMAIDRGVPEIYVFDLSRHVWTYYHDDFGSGWQDNSKIVGALSPPKPHGRYAGIGSRELSSKGREAIRDLYR